MTKRGRRTTGDDATSESPWELAAATPAIDVVPSELNAPVAQALDDDISSGSLARKASRGLSWSLLGTLVVKLGSFVMALINEYPPGAPIGWHRDAPQYDIVFGVSLLSACRMMFRPFVSPAAHRATDGRRRQATHERPSFGY